MLIRRAAATTATIAIAFGISLIPAQASTVVLSRASSAVLAAPSGADPVAKHYANCTALNKKYKHGVGKKGAKDHVTSGSPVTNFTRSNALYAANKGKDRDHDGIACEKH